MTLVYPSSLKGEGDWIALAGDRFITPANAPDAPAAFVTSFVRTDKQRPNTRIWATLGVRLAKLRVSYRRNWPMVRHAASDPWQPARDSGVVPADAWYLIPVDEFAEIELPRLGVLNRDEFRAVCDQQRTRGAIVRTLQEPAR